MRNPLKRSLVDIALEQIRQRIDNGSWALGERLPPEPELAERLGMSRNTVREAVRVLAFSGVLEVRQGDGTYVRARTEPMEIMLTLARGSIEQALEARGVIEVEAARLAAQRRDADDIAALRAALEASAQAHGLDLEHYVECDLAFHQCIVDSAHNPLLSELYRYFSQVIGAGLRQTISEPGRPQPAFDLHRQLLDAIERGDADAAEAANRALLI